MRFQLAKMGSFFQKDRLLPPAKIIWLRKPQSLAKRAILQRKGEAVGRRSAEPSPFGYGQYFFILI